MERMQLKQNGFNGRLARFIKKHFLLSYFLLLLGIPLVMLFTVSLVTLAAQLLPGLLFGGAVRIF